MASGKDLARDSTRARERKTEEDNIKECTCVDFNSSQGAIRGHREPKMAEVYRRCQQWCPYDPDGSGDTGNIIYVSIATHGVLYI